MSEGSEVEKSLPWEGREPQEQQWEMRLQRGNVSKMGLGQGKDFKMFPQSIGKSSRALTVKWHDQPAF